MVVGGGRLLDFRELGPSVATRLNPHPVSK